MYKLQNYIDFIIFSDAEIRLQPSNTEVSAAFNRIQAQLTPDILRRIRIYLTVARLSNYNLSEDMQKVRLLTEDSGKKVR